MIAITQQAALKDFLSPTPNQEIAPANHPALIPVVDRFVIAPVKKFQSMDLDRKIDFGVSLIIYAAALYSGASIFRATKRLWRSSVPGEVGALRGLGLFLKQAGSGFHSGLKGLSHSFRENVRDPAIQKRLLLTGGVSGLTRFGYDKLTGNDEEAWSNAVKAFAFGGLCGGIRPTVPLVPGKEWVNRTIVPFLQKTIPFHYIGLDLLGSISRKYLTDCREKYGEATGWTLAMGGMVLSGTSATVLFLPFLQTWGRAFKKTVLPIIIISCLMESTIQRSNGKRWRDIDPGRFVGMSAWGFSIVILPESLLQGAAKVHGIAGTFSRTTDLWIRYLFFINPSAANFSATITDQHWWNSQFGNFARQGTIMYASRYVQSVFGASALTSMIADETIGGLSLLAANAIWRLYEGRSTMWEEELRRHIKVTDGSARSYDELTDFISVKMGSVSHGQYMPSALNLQLARELMKKEDWEQFQDQFKRYLNYLSVKEKRTPAEEEILKAFTTDSRAAAESARSGPQDG